jgi:Ca-activated chloride channel family protein
MSSLTVSAAAHCLVTADGRNLPLRSMQLEVTAAGGLASTVLRQRFANVYSEPLQVEYRLPLPADGAVGAFAFRIGDRTVTGEIAGRDEARQRFLTAQLEGRTAALIEQERSSLFTQELANVPPGAEVEAELTIDQPLLWLTSGTWEYRFPTTVAPRYLGEPGRLADAHRLTTAIADGDVPARVELRFVVGDDLGAAVISPSHALQAQPNGWSFAAKDGVAPDRDVVLRWPGAPEELTPRLRTARPPADAPHGACAYGLLTLAPPLRAPRAVARDLVVLLDVSGSMSGAPLLHAVAVVRALVDGLTDRDRLMMTAFASEPRTWHSSPRVTDAATRAEALQWLGRLQAGGGTEMQTAISAALQTLRPGAQTQVLLVTDGQIGFEQEVVRDVLTRLPEGCRLHVLGVGDSPNRSLTMPAARAGRGCEAIVGLGDDPAVAAARLHAAMLAPLVTDLVLDGPALLDCAPARVPDLLAGAPLRLALRLRAEGGELRLRGRTSEGPFAQTIVVSPASPASGEAAITTHYGRQHLEDLELRIAAGEPAKSLESEIERIGLQFGLASRCTSWVAISEEPTVDPRQPTRRIRVPHQLAHGLSVEGLGLRHAEGTRFHATRLAEPFPAICELGAPGLYEGPARNSRRVTLWRPSFTLHVVQRVLDALWLEITGLDGEWVCPEEVELRWNDGSKRVVRRLPNGTSTPSGQVTADLVLRLALQLPPDAPPALPIAIHLHGQWLPLSHSRP